MRRGWVTCGVAPWDGRRGGATWGSWVWWWQVGGRVASRESRHSLATATGPRPLGYGLVGVTGAGSSQIPPPAPGYNYPEAAGLLVRGIRSAIIIAAVVASGGAGGERGGAGGERGERVASVARRGMGDVGQLGVVVASGWCSGLDHLRARRHVSARLLVQDDQGVAVGGERVLEVVRHVDAVRVLVRLINEHDIWRGEEGVVRDVQQVSRWWWWWWWWQRGGGCGTAAGWARRGGGRGAVRKAGARGGQRREPRTTHACVARQPVVEGARVGARVP